MKLTLVVNNNLQDVTLTISVDKKPDKKIIKLEKKVDKLRYIVGENNSIMQEAIEMRDTLQWG